MPIRLDRRLRAKTFSGLPTETLNDALLQVPTVADEGDSSQGDVSSPETPPEPEQKTEQKGETVKNHQKKKKKRQPRIIKGTPTGYNLPIYSEEEMNEPHDISGRTMNYQSDGETTKVSKQLSTLATPRIEKSASFKKRAKPENLEKLAKQFVENKENKRVSVRSDSRLERGMECNIVLLGDLGVGKTALAVRFVTKRYLPEYDPSLERTYEKTIQCSGDPVFVRLFDTVNRSWENYTEKADGFIVMYSVTSLQSQSNAVNIINSIRSDKNPQLKNVPILLLGNKKELEQARKVSKEEPEKIAIANGCSFREISIACTNNVDGVVKAVVKQIKAQEGGRTTPTSMMNDQGSHKHSTTSLSRKPSNAKHKMKNFLKKKEKP